MHCSLWRSLWSQNTSQCEYMRGWTPLHVKDVTSSLQNCCWHESLVSSLVVFVKLNMSFRNNWWLEVNSTPKLLNYTGLWNGIQIFWKSVHTRHLEHKNIWPKDKYLNTPFEYLTHVAVVIPLDSSWSWDSIWLLICRVGTGTTYDVCVFVRVLQIPQALAELKWHLNDRFPASTWAICTCLFSVKANKLERLPATICLSGLAIIQRLGWATEELRAWRYKRRVARSRSLVVWMLTVM